MYCCLIPLPLHFESFAFSVTGWRPIKKETNGILYE